MAKITRKLMKIFGSNSGTHEMGVFGSLAAASPTYSTDVETIQSLSNWLDGWYSAIIMNNSPATQDFNAVFYVLAYQVAYLMQAGIAEWDTNTTYYKGSLAQSGGQVFVSIADDNLAHAVTNSTYWLVADSAVVALTFSNTGYVLSGTNKWEKTALVNTAGGATSVVLPAASGCAGNRLTVIKTSADVNAVTVSVSGGGTIDGAASQTLENQYMGYDYISTGSEWIVL